MVGLLSFVLVPATLPLYTPPSTLSMMPVILTFGAVKSESMLLDTSLLALPA